MRTNKEQMTKKFSGEGDPRHNFLGIFSNLFIFKVSKDELGNIFKEMVEDKDKHDSINEIRKIVYDKPFQYLMVNTDSGRMFKNWDELIWDE